MRYFLFSAFFPAALSIVSAQFNGSVIANTNPCLPGSYQYQQYEWPEPPGATCSGIVNPAVIVQKVYFAQNHVMEPDWPLFYLIANRPALLIAVVIGSGASPEVKVEGWINDVPLTPLCLSGPAALPASVSFDEPRFDDRFTVTLPKAWMQPGLRIQVTAGTSVKAFSQEQLGVQYDPEINLFMVPIDVLNYNDGKEDVEPPETLLPDLASEMPAAVTRFGRFPARMKLPVFITGGPGNSAGTAPVLIDRRLCGNNETPGPDCTDDPNVAPGDINGGVLRLIQALSEATGDYPFSFCYGNTENFNPGGWGGGKHFVGAGYSLVFIHEFGHALSLPHWSSDYGRENPGQNDRRYPYGGITGNGGGRGDTWQYIQAINEFVSPICQDERKSEVFGKERSDAMQRNAQCNEWRSSGRGPWDGFGDFSSLAMFRFMTGAAEPYSGMVPYSRDGQAPFAMKVHAGFPTMEPHGNGSCTLVRNNPETRDWEKYDFLIPNQMNVPVFTVYGIYHPQYEFANIIYQPMAYVGNLPKVLDPTDPATFADLSQKISDNKYSDYFWWPRDLTFRFVYEDNSVLHALYPHGSVNRDWTLGSGIWRNDLLYWAMTIPANKGLRRIELYHRPFCLRHGNMTDEGNVGNPDLGITAANFMDAATLIKALDVSIPAVSVDDSRQSPAGSSKVVTFSIEGRGAVFTGALDSPREVTISNVRGALIHAFPATGPHITWDGRDRSGNRLQKGVYIIRLYGDESACQFRAVIVD